jgi:hypothetical protein
MLCPACRNSLIVVEYKQIELDYCTQCRGVWFDVNEVELLLKSLNLDSESGKFASIYHLPEAKISELGRKCPVCRKKMRKVHLGDEHGIAIDVCNNKEGIWFDGGEVVHMIKEAAERSVEGKGSGNQVINFLGEVFSV